ncbi:MAG TPA: transglycosylase SLT domain-containing protein [Bacteroidales bacterium]|nr:transglycosylase SLT domain-containing protein [Bacteroidales bacterium]
MIKGKGLLMVSIFLFVLAVVVYGETEANAKKPKKAVVEKVASPLEVVNDVPNAMDENVPFIAIAPEVPDEIEFCGNKIDLTRIDMRERFDRELMAMVYMHTSSLTLLKRANRYFPMIEPILKDSGIPDDIKYLACIESTLSPIAISSAKAVGLWQFMPETAKQYGLEVSGDVDERYNVKKETAAACKYLKDAYAKYSDWPSACASYNIGTNRITLELQRQGVATGLDLWLVEETSRYVFRILACKEFLTHPKKYGYYIRKDQLYQPIECKDTVITGRVPNWIDFAKQQGINFYDLKYCNSWIRNDSLPNLEMKSYNVSIPLKESLNFNKKKLTVHQDAWVIDPN